MLLLLKKNKEKIKDFTSVPETNEVAGITIPIITLEKYPQIIERGSNLVLKLAHELAGKEGRAIDEILDNLEILDIFKYIPTIVKIATEEFFDFVAFVLDTDKERIKKLGMADLMRIIRKTYEVNEFAEVQKELENFIKALTGKRGQGKQNE